MQKILILLGILAIIGGVALYLVADRYPVETKNLLGSTITVPNPHLQMAGVISGALSALMIILGFALKEKTEVKAISAAQKDTKNDEVNIIKIIIKSFKSLIEDPTYILIYSISFAISLIFYIYLWVTYGSLIPWTGVTTSAELKSLFISLIIPIVLYFVAQSVISLWITAAITLKVNAKEKNKNMGAGACLSEGIRYFPNLFVAGLLLVAIVAGPILMSALIAVVVPSLWVFVALMTVMWMLPLFYIGVRLSLFIQVCVLDESGPVDGIKECWRLSKGNFWIIFVTIILISVPALILNQIPQIGMIISTIVVGPPSTIALVLLYLGIKKVKPSKS